MLILLFSMIPVMACAMPGDEPNIPVIMSDNDYTEGDNRPYGRSIRLLAVNRSRRLWPVEYSLFDIIFQFRIVCPHPEPDILTQKL